MSQLHYNKSNIKKLEESFSDHNSDHHDDTQLQTPDIPNYPKNSKHPTKTQPKSAQIQKKEQDKTKVSKNQPIRTLPELKSHQQDQKVKTRSRKYEDLKSVKNFAQDQVEEQNIQPLKKPRGNHKKIIQDHQKMEENQKRAYQIIEKLQKVYDEDVNLYKKGKPADKKLKYILEAQKSLKEISLVKSFLNMAGHLVFIDWLLPNPDTLQETSLTVKIHVFNLLAEMRLTKENIETGEQLQKVLRKYRKSRYEILRNLSSCIVEQWKIVKGLSDA